MYKRYQISIPENQALFATQYYYDKGVSHLKKTSDSLESQLDRFEQVGVHLDADFIMKNWFPDTAQHVFISHSHSDEKQVIMLCGWLSDRFGINSFVDSKLWGYSNKLLKIIDNKFSKSIVGTTYDYDKRNISTSHVHVMLMSSLIKMIDKAECLLFVNTESSVAMNEGVNEEKTLSPWIYSELSVSNVIKINVPARRKELIKATNESYRFDSLAGIAQDSAVTALYDIAGILREIKKIPLETLAEWHENVRDTPKANLDWLYDNVYTGGDE